ncbi:hypothetical protein I317_03966 [Kwoniella heveanensis CBS 569]|uniref:Methyltransferase type 11 domain-containing protein n=1 Tax=Kwoniella heveanensis BCC8398 TaxID=1296120 RepID=A0A1B9H411_9TREE|nr:hypothetical protein I316_00229 [Kwoniella heveanensis BCC8398]OCF42231.1 hypothetical protein I317_03966 [Kwoniella heveanensis CBS 569]
MRSSVLRALRPVRPAFTARRALLPRTYATLNPHTPPPTTPYEVFDEPSKDRQRDRAILRLRQDTSDPADQEGSDVEDPVKVVDYLREEIAERLAERIEDLKTPPGSILELAAHSGQLTQILQEVLADEVPSESENQDAQDQRRKWWIVESSEGALNRDDDSLFASPPTRIQASPSNLLSHPQIQPLIGNVEAVVSAGGLHWVGDIVGALTQVRHVLKPDGVFVGAVLGGDTLFELRTSLQLAEQERRGGIANRVSPMINPTDAPSLLNRAGFTLTTIDVEDMTINYPSLWELMADLRDMGESNAILGRRTHVSRDVLLAAEAIYKAELYGNEDGSVPATFQIIFLIGWKPGPNQPKPLERGSATTNLKDVL